MIRLSNPPNDTLKIKILLFLLTISAITHAGELEKIMVNSQSSLWQVIAEIEKKMPISVGDTEKTLGVSFVETKSNENFTHLSGSGLSLDENVLIKEVNLMLSPSLEFDSKSALVLEIDGQCVTLAKIREKFFELALMQAPRGRSLQETTVWSSARKWGIITFAFKEERPLCLSRVGFRRS